MKCELKYIEHDVVKTLKKTTVVTFLVAWIVCLLAVFICDFLFGDVGLWILIITSWLMIPVLGWKKAKEFCKNKKLIVMDDCGVGMNVRKWKDV